jgi:methionyl aminopeptidase
MTKQKVYLKTEEEISIMREAGLILQDAQKAMQKIITPGISLIELDDTAENIIRKSGAKPGFKGYHGFPNTICTMVNSEIVHGIPDHRKLREGDLISIDCGVLLKDLNADAAFTVIVGGEDKNPVRAKFSATVKKALHAGVSQAVAGNRLGDIGHAIESTVRAGGYSIVKEYTGHGIGYELHEDPHVYNYGKPGKGMLLKEGMTLAIEPIVTLGKPGNKTLKDGWTIVTLDGKDACQWEHFGVVRKDHFEVLA